MTTGVITSFDQAEGKGYIQPDGGGDEVPFDRESLTDAQGIDALITAGERVAYTVEGGLAGMMAKDVRRIPAHE